jgi:hypothetical protein
MCTNPVPIPVGGCGRRPDRLGRAFFAQYSSQDGSMRFASTASVHGTRHPGRVLAALLLLMSVTTPAWAQRPGWHYFHSADLPPGAIGSGQALRGGPTPGYFQPVEVRAPEGVLISPAVNGQFLDPKPGSLLAGMLIGQVYRLRVSNIPDQETDEVFPTIEVVSRLHPPPGQAVRFPIPIQLTLEELKLAIGGRYVTRVIYLEDPATAIPLRDEADGQRYFEVQPRQDPLQVADELGRPMAILRMGSRVPDLARETTNLGFNYGQPPLLLFDKPIHVPRDSGLEPPPEDARPATAGRVYRRIPMR